MKPGSKFLLFISLLRILSCELTTFDRWKWKRRHRCKCHLPLPFKENLFFQSLAISFRCLKAGVCICRGMKLLLTRGCLFCIVIFPIVHEKSSPSKKKTTTYNREEVSNSHYFDNHQNTFFLSIVIKQPRSQSFQLMETVLLSSKDSTGLIEKLNSSILEACRSTS